MILFESASKVEKEKRRHIFRYYAASRYSNLYENRTSVLPASSIVNFVTSSSHDALDVFLIYLLTICNKVMPKAKIHTLQNYSGKSGIGKKGTRFTTTRFAQKHIFVPKWHYLKLKTLGDKDLTRL